jgi:hypothetical protein
MRRGTCREGCAPDVRRSWSAGVGGYRFEKQEGPTTKEEEVALSFSVSLSHELEIFLGPRKWISIDGIHIRLAAGHRGSQSDGYAALLEELPFSGYNHVMTCSTMYLSKSTSSHVG